MADMTSLTIVSLNLNVIAITGNCPKPCVSLEGTTADTSKSTVILVRNAVDSPLVIPLN